jgi:phosphoglycerate dehydrogenase-like enzyme
MTRPSASSPRKLLVLTSHRLELFIAPEWFSQRLAAEFPRFHVVQLNSYDNILEQMADVEIMFGISLRVEQFLAAPGLRWIHSQAAAVHQFMFPELINSGVILTNAREVHGPVVAEHVLGLILALAKMIPMSVRLQQQRVWGQDIIWDSRPRIREIAGATLGLVGLGSIGRNLARHAAAMGMNVIAVRQHPAKQKPESVQEVLSVSQLDQLLARSDYVVLAAPVTPATAGLIGREQLAQMKPEACLINVGRGPLVDEAALVEALRNKSIGGAALDVFEEEPLPPESPLWELENLLITPHLGGMTDKLWERHYALFAENLRRYLSDEPLLGLVDKKGGY